MAAQHPLHPASARADIATGPYAPVVRRISWGAVFAGVTMALVVQVLLAMLGAGIGLATLDPAGEGSPEAGAFGTGAAVWWVASMLVAFFIGGWVAGRMAGLPTASDGRLHGLLAWGLTTLLMLYLLTSTVGGVIGGAFNLMGSVAGQGAQAAASVGERAVGPLVDRAKEVAREAGVEVDAAPRGEAPMSAQQKAEAAHKGREAADRAANAGAQAGIWGFVALALAAIAAAIGGTVGRPRDALLVA